jgi:hypothetical protein
MNFVDFCFFTAVGDRGEWHELLFFAVFPSAVLGELSSLCPRQGELLVVCPKRALCALPSRRESLFLLDSWDEEEDDDDES